MESSYAYREYDYPLNLLMEIFVAGKLPDYQAEDFHETLETVLNTLPEQEQTALLCRYRQQMTFSEIAALIDKSTERARQLVNKGLRLMRHPTRTRQLTGAPVKVVEPPQNTRQNDGKIHIADMGLRYQTYNCLLRMNIQTADEILIIPPEELMQTKGVGRKTYTEIIERLAALGFDVAEYQDVDALSKGVYKRKYRL